MTDKEKRSYNNGIICGIVSQRGINGDGSVNSSQAHDSETNKEKLYFQNGFIIGSGIARGASSIEVKNVDINIQGIVLTYNVLPHVVGGVTKYSVTLNSDECDDYEVDWGDGTTGNKSSGGYHEYDSQGTYNVTIQHHDLTRFIALDSQYYRLVAVSGSLVGCEALTTLEGCFSNKIYLTSVGKDVFNNCSNVTNASMIFNGCSLISSVPTGIFAAFENVYSSDDFSGGYHRTFDGCSSLETIPSNLFASSALVTNFTFTFRDCISLVNIPDSLFYNNTNITTLTGTFWNTGVVNIPSNLLKYCVSLIEAVGTFALCNSLYTIDADSFKYCVSLKRTPGLFMECASLSAIPSTIFDHCQDIYDFDNTFRNCSSVHGNAPALWTRTNVTTHNETFYGCNNLSNYSSIPSTWK